jgi:hypothetical protein
MEHRTILRSRLGTWSALLIVLSHVIIGCSVLPIDTQAPTWCASGGCVGIPADPPRSAVLRGAGSCVWLELDNGHKAAPLWPPGYRIHFNPIIVTNPAGAEVARQGATLTTQMLGPMNVAADPCGLTEKIDVFYPEPAH